MKKNTNRNEERLINLMCLAPGITPAYALIVDQMTGEIAPRI